MEKKFTFGNGYETRLTATTYEDNQRAIAIAKNDGYQSRAKHVAIRHHFVLEQVRSGNIDLQYISSDCQLADFLTKLLSTVQFQTLLRKTNIGDCKSRESVEAIL
uniref:Putative polyprotein n=1 Tax=Albugo laibachii Nc14 TaxID=890382 RepID=F0W8J5_9STRA|nr:putative polyprotein [Albugo laibachii Nc14]CCA25700.1 putative polyprotein [Albugo laibachii Nc14]|eukprot:CCA25700.1 putative polyprotein [Albugo laibachii Nc14]